MEQTQSKCKMAVTDFGRNYVVGQASRLSLKSKKFLFQKQRSLP